MYRKAFFAICLNGFALAFTWGITVTNIPWLFDRVGIKETDLGIWFTIFAVLQLIFSQLSGRVIVPLIGTTKTLMLGQLSFAIFHPSTILSPNQAKCPNMARTNQSNLVDGKTPVAAMSFSTLE